MKFKAFVFSIATNHYTYSQVHCSIACKSLRSAQALQCAADLFDPVLRARLMVWFTETFGLSLVRLSDFIGTSGFSVVECSEGAGFIVTILLTVLHLKNILTKKVEYLEPSDDPYIFERSALAPKKSKVLILK